MAELERDLGLYETVTISIGAMVGSGIFVLPALAYGIAGPAVVLAYFLAGLLVLPAALSKAEMATALPESGGTYLYIDRAMGPLPGTVAGLGAWLSLVFKSAFAIVGLGAYLVVFLDVSPTVVTVVAVVVAVLLVAVNVVGVKQTGRLQAAIVTVVLLALVAFIADGLTYVDGGRFHPFFGAGSGTLLAATGFVFVSYAGVTKIASVAEEVEAPGRNLPLGILGSIAVMVLVYTFVVFVVVGVTPAAALTDGKVLRPMYVAARQFAPTPGAALAVAGVAVLALASMANAGVLSASRFPLAMSRDALAPPALSTVSERFHTPRNAILLTGAILVVLIVALPVRDLAKLASAFQILVFAIVNAALVAFRESGLDWYDPDFRAPGYPWVQLLGILGGAVLLTQMGLTPLLGAGGIVVAGLVWYRVYGRARTDREGAAIDALRRTTSARSLSAVRERVHGAGRRVGLVAVRPDTSMETETTLVRVAGDVLGRDGRMTLARFEAVPDQATLSGAAQRGPDGDREAALLDDRVRTAVEVADVVTHDIEEAVVNYADTCGAGLIVGAWEPDRLGGELLGHDVDWFMRHADADLLFVRDRGYDDPDTVAVVAERGVYDPLAVAAADAIAARHGATVQLLYTLSPSASDEQREAVDAYHDRLTDLLTVPATVALLETDDPHGALLAAAGEADVAVVTTSSHSLLYDAVFGTLPDRLADDLPCTVVLAHARRSRTGTVLGRLLERVAF